MRFLFAFLVLGMVCSAVASTSRGDLIFVNGAVYTVDPARTWASALVVTGNRITYVGDDATARSFTGPKSHVVDLKQRMLLPGFQDSHVHPALVPNPNATVLLDGLTQREQVLERIQQFAKAHPQKTWIIGSLWDEVAFLPSGQPTKEMLDAVVPDRPAYLDDNSGHEGWANSRALAAAHITMATPDPLNGRIERDARGEPTGTLQEESAMDLVRSVIPPPSPEEQVATLAAALHKMTSQGFTAIEDAYVTPGGARAYKTLDETGRLDLRTNLCLVFMPLENDDAQFEYFVAQRKALAGRRLRATCVKILLDGAYGSHTVVLLQPYSDDPQRFGRGKLFVEQDRLNRLVTRLDAAGFQIHMHTQGDGAVHAALDSFSEARRKNGFRDNRHTLAHLCHIDATHIPRFRTLKVIANMTPIWSLDDAWETVFAPRLFGPERSQHIFQTRTLLDSGVVLVWGSDWPVTSVSPFDGLETAITHRYPGGKDLNGNEDHVWLPQERVNLEQALVAYTTTGAYLMHDDSMRGSLSVGKAADLVVIDKNVFETPPLNVHTTQADMTVLDGKIIFARDVQ